MRSIGADDVIDYTRKDFAESRRHFDLLFDCVGNRPVSACRRVLTAKGIYVGIGGGGPETTSFRVIADSVTRMVLSWFVTQELRGFIAKTRHEDLATLRDLMTSGEVTPVIDRRFPLSEISEALRYVEAGHARGKVIIGVG